MASEVNRQNISAEDFFLLSRGYSRILLTLPLVCAATLRLGVAAPGLHQTANPGQNRPAFRLDAGEKGTRTYIGEVNISASPFALQNHPPPYPGPLKGPRRKGSLWTQAKRNGRPGGTSGSFSAFSRH